MRRTIFKIYPAWDFEREEKWLNEMAAKGLSLVAVGLFNYTFEETPPGQYKVRIELLEKWPTTPESEHYIRFLEETGIEYLGAFTRWAYFRRKSEDGDFDLFSDNASKLKQIKRLVLLFGILLFSLLLQALTQLMVYFNSGFVGNLSVGLMSVALALMIGYGFMRTLLIMRKIKADQQLFE